MHIFLLSFEHARCPLHRIERKPPDALTYISTFVRINRLVTSACRKIRNKIRVKEVVMTDVVEYKNKIASIDKNEGDAWKRCLIMSFDFVIKSSYGWKRMETVDARQIVVSIMDAHKVNSSSNITNSTTTEKIQPREMELSMLSASKCGN